MQLNCWSLRCSWSNACRRCSNHIFSLNWTRLQYIGQRQLQPYMRNAEVLGFGASYIRDFMVMPHNKLVFTDRGFIEKNKQNPPPKNVNTCVSIVLSNGYFSTKPLKYAMTVTHQWTTCTIFQEAECLSIYLLPVTQIHFINCCLRSSI